MVSRRKDNDLDTLAALGEQAKASGDPSGFMTDGLVSSDFSVVLSGCLDFDPELPEYARKQIATKVTYDPKLPRPITADVLLRQCSKLEREYLSLPKRKFRLLTEISLWWTIDVPPTRIGSTALTFKSKNARGFKERARLYREMKSTVGFDLPRHYMQLSALVTARTPDEAAERALKDIDILRASWNLAINRGKAWRHSGGRPPPINEIRLSPFHTVHESNGKLIDHQFWYDPGYSCPAKPYNDSVKFVRLLSFAKKLRTRLAKLPYRPEIEEGLIRYVRALDSSDLNDAFLRLWSLLEFLTDSSYDPYKVATRRAAFMFADRERSQLVLTHLTNYRNRFVHAGSETNDIEPLVFMLKRYVDALLIFHIGNVFGFESRTDAARFMDHPTSYSEIDIRVKRLRQARKFLSSDS